MLIVLILFNVLGYYGLFVGLHFKNTQDIIRKADNHSFDDSETITLKVPINIPYSGNSDYKRVNGEVEHKGDFYRLIKQKISQDTVYIVCVKDLDTKQLSLSLTEFVKTFTDKSGAEGSKLIKNFIKDYIFTIISPVHTSAGWNMEIVHYYNKAMYSFHHAAEVIQPPEA